MKTSKADIIREYGPFPEAEAVHGVSFDGKHVWFASGDRLNSFDPETGATSRSLDIAGDAGTAFDGRLPQQPTLAPVPAARFQQSPVPAARR